MGGKKKAKKKKKEKEEYKPSSKDIFAMFDENYDDTLDYDEFVRVIEDLMPGTSQEDTDLHFEEANLAEDGYVTLEEFQECWATGTMSSSRTSNLSSDSPPASRLK